MHGFKLSAKTNTSGDLTCLTEKLLIVSALIPSQEDYILRGDHTAVSDPTTVRAEIIRKVEGWGMDAFGAGELPDWRVMT